MGNYIKVTERQTNGLAGEISLFIKRLEGLKKAEGIQIYVLFSISKPALNTNTLISAALMACGETGLVCSNMLCLIVLT